MTVNLMYVKTNFYYVQVNFLYTRNALKFNICTDKFYYVIIYIQNFYLVKLFYQIFIKSNKKIEILNVNSITN